MFTRIKDLPPCGYFARHKRSGMCNSFQEAPLRTAGSCPYLLFFSLVLPGGQKAATLAGVQETFPDQGQQTKDSGSRRAIKLDPWQLWSHRTRLYPRAPPVERKPEHLSEIRHRYLRFSVTCNWSKAYLTHGLLLFHSGGSVCYTQQLPTYVFFSLFLVGGKARIPLCSPLTMLGVFLLLKSTTLKSYLQLLWNLKL